MRDPRNARPERNDHPPGLENETERYGSENDVERAWLERQTMDAIVEHRRRISEAEIVESRLREAESCDRTYPNEVQKLEADCARLRLDLAAHQLMLSALLKQLGYVPEVGTAAQPVS